MIRTSCNRASQEPRPYPRLWWGKISPVFYMCLSDPSPESGPTDRKKDCVVPQYVLRSTHSVLRPSSHPSVLPLLPTDDLSPGLLLPGLQATRTLRGLLYRTSTDLCLSSGIRLRTRGSRTDTRVDKDLEVWSPVHTTGEKRGVSVTGRVVVVAVPLVL